MDNLENTISTRLFMEFVRSGDMDMIRQSLEQSKYDVNSTDESGRTALHHAVLHAVATHEVSIVSSLIHHGCDVNIKDDTAQRETALHISLRLGDIDTTKLLLSSPLLDVVKCGSYQKKKMLPECSVNEKMSDVTRILQDDVTGSDVMFQVIREEEEDDDDEGGVAKDTTPTVRRIMLVRQDATEYFTSHFRSGNEPISDLIIIQNETLSNGGFLSLECLQPSCLHSSTLQYLYLVDCPLDIKENCFDPFSHLSLHTLVLSHSNLRHLPSSIFRMHDLEVLIVNQNNLESIPLDVGNLTSLVVFSCDRQRPGRLRSLPHTIRHLTRLKTLSFTGNKVKRVPWIGALTELRVLRAGCNRIRRLPDQLTELSLLKILDISHNRIERLQPCLADLIKRLYKFEYHNQTMRPRHILRSREDLLAHMRLEAVLEWPSPNNVEHGGCGSSTAASSREALDISNHSESGDSDGSSVGAARRQGWSRDLVIGIVGETNAGKAALVEALRSEKGLCKQDGAKSKKLAFGYYEVHHFVLSSEESQGGTSDKHMCTAVVMANDILDDFRLDISVDLYLLAVDLTGLELQRGTHHLFTRHINRLAMWLTSLYELNPSVPVLVVGTHADLVRNGGFVDVWKTFESTLLDQARMNHIQRYGLNGCSGGGSRGVVGYHRYCLLCNPRKQAVRHAFTKLRPLSGGFVDLSFAQIVPDETIATANGSLISEVASHQMSNCKNYRSNNSVLENSHGSPSSSTTGKYRFPHVLGFYEIDSKKCFPKDTKKTNLSIEHLRDAILRLTRVRSSAAFYVPNPWLSFARHIGSIKDKASNIPCLPFDEVVAIARSFDINSGQVPLVLQYLHGRGQVVYFGRDEVLRQIVVIDPGWFVQTVSRVLNGQTSSASQMIEILKVLGDKDLERQLQKINSSTLSSQWIFRALQLLRILVPMQDSREETYYLFPHILESGTPSQDVWPDVPDWDERQITCTMVVRCLKPGAFLSLVRRIIQHGRQQLQILPEPSPVFLSHHIVFFTGLDCDGCDDCIRIRKNLREQTIRQDSPSTAGPQGEMSSHDDIVHKVLISLKPRMTSLMIQVRGVSPCCVLKEVLSFLELYFDDEVDDDDDDNSSLSCSDDDDSSRYFKESNCNVIENDTLAYRDSIGNNFTLIRGSSNETDTTINSRHISLNTDSRVQINNLDSKRRAQLTGSSVDKKTLDGNNEGFSTADSRITLQYSCSRSDYDNRELFLLCPKCVLLRQAQPERISYPCAASRRRAICGKWHNLGSWTRVSTGDYRFSSLDLPSTVSLTTLPDIEHPRLVLILPPSLRVATNDWYLFQRMRFLEGFEAHFLCEYTGYWHMTDDPGYRLNQSTKFSQHSGYEMNSLLRLSLPLIQSFQGVQDHPQNGRLLAPVIADLISMYDYLETVDRQLQTDPCAWLTKHKDRVVTMLTKVLANATSGLPDAYSKASNPISADTIFEQRPGSGARSTNRYALARFLRLDTSSGKFGTLRPVYIGRDLRWVCEAHYEELRTMPSK